MSNLNISNIINLRGLSVNLENDGVLSFNLI